MVYTAVIHAETKRLMNRSYQFIISLEVVTASNIYDTGTRLGIGLYYIKTNC